MKKFVLIGAAGYVAPKHMKAIYETGNTLVAAYDKHSSVGALDKYFPDCKFFSTYSDLDLFVHSHDVDYVVVCAPNNLHAPISAGALARGADVICEKPLCLHPSDITLLQDHEQIHNKRVNTILQLRLHPEIISLKKHVERCNAHHKVEIVYHAPRGDWYYKSWKGDYQRSGGILMNIGVHFFDLLLWIFGDHNPNKYSCTIYNDGKSARGALSLDRADVKWALSTDNRHDAARILSVDGVELDLSSHITDLHTLSYEKILAGDGFGVEESGKSIKLIKEIEG